MSITDPKNNDPNSLMYYAPRRLRDRVHSLRAAQLRQGAGQSIPTVPLQPPDTPVPEWYDADEIPPERPFPESLRSLETEAIESLRELNRRNRRAEVVALGGRFAAVGCIAAAVAFGYVFYFTGGPDEGSASKDSAEATAPRTDKLVSQPAQPAPANAAFAAADPTTSKPLPLNSKTEEQAHNTVASFKMLPADAKSTFGAAPPADHVPAATDTSVKVIPTIAVPRADGDGEPARQIKPEVITAMLKRAEGLISTGDIPAARLLLERAAEAHNARAAFELAATYDPTVIRQSGNIGPRPDLALARAWYQKARDWGSPDAGRQLDALARADK
ncbi:MAG TPA: hypothetical protein VFL51_00275 [Pseudolabrys sp.]|nr:hypothetical protein [Pseudolabrys sp.]